MQFLLCSAVNRSLICVNSHAFSKLGLSGVYLDIHSCLFMFVSQLLIPVVFWSEAILSRLKNCLDCLRLFLYRK